MTSLEFIEKEIQNAKELLQRLEKLKVNSNKYELQLNEVLEKDTQEKLFYLQQIKSELEAWKIVKDNTIITNNRCDVDRIEMYNGGEGYNIFKKALKKNEN